MPLDSAPTGTPEPVKIDRSSGVGAALSGMVEKELPGALAESKSNDEAKKALAFETAGRLDADSAKRATLQAPLPPPPPPAPDPQFRSQGEAWGSLAMVMASIGSAFTRRPFLNSLNAGAEVMKAFRAGDLEAYKRNFERWKVESEYGLKMYEYQRDAYKDAIASIDTDQQGALAKMRVLSAAFEDTSLHRLVEAANVGGTLALLKGRGTAEEKATVELDKTRREGEIAQELLESDKALRANPNDPAAKERRAAAEQAAKDFHLARRGGGGTADERLHQETDLFAKLKEEWKANNPGKELTATIEADLRAKAHAPVSGRGQGALQPTLSEDDARRMAQQYVAGQHNVLQGLGYGNAGAANRAFVQQKITEESIRLAKEAGIPEEKIGEYLAIKSAEFAGITAGERTLGIRTTQLGLAAQEAQLLMPAVLRASEAVPRTELTDLNKLILSGEQRTGDPNTVRLGIAINSLVNVYARAISPTGTPTVSDKEHFRELMAPFWSKGQIQAALDQLNIELDAALRSPARVRQEFREGLGGQVSSPAHQYGFPGGSGAPGAAPSGGLSHEKEAVKAGAPRDAVRKRYIEGGGDAATFDREVK